MEWWKRINARGLLGKEYSGIKFLGHGLNGAVFRARSKSAGALVAIKFVRVKRDDALTRKRFLSEVEAMQRLDGDGAVRVFDVNIKANPPFYVMEYLELGDFRKLLVKRTTTTALALDVFLSVCDCVAKCHARNITHRDLKPENILFRRVDNPILSDFGICKIDDLPLGTTVFEMQNRGTPFYMAPEQLKDNLVQSKPADVYALGMILQADIGLRIRDANLKDKVANISHKCREFVPDRRSNIEDLKNSVQRIRADVQELLDKRPRLHRLGMMVNALRQRAGKIDQSVLIEEAEELYRLMRTFNGLVPKEREYSVSKDWNWKSLSSYDDQVGFGYSRKNSLSLAEQLRVIRSEAKRFFKHIDRTVRMRI